MSNNPNIKPTPAHQRDEEAREAEALQGNAMLARCLDELEAMYTEEWKKTEGPHTDYRERAYYMVRAIDKLRQHINEFVQNRKVNPTRVKRTVQGKED